LIGAVPISKLLLNDVVFFWATNKISGYRQKKKEEVALPIAAKVASDNIYASIGRLGMTMERDGPVAGGGAGKSRRIGVRLSGQKHLQRLVCTFMKFLCGFQLGTVIWFM
jgi:hypothetical protein